MITGDQLLPRVALHFDYGFSPDPVSEFLASLDKIERHSPSMCLPGHGSPFNDAAGVIAGTRRATLERIGLVAHALGGEKPLSAFDLVVRLLGGRMDPDVGRHALPETLAYLKYLQLQGKTVRERASSTYLWSLLA
jgi:glyoxylase-like metal-dependent hydrolase (beta-lactamase superfamily II)